MQAGIVSEVTRLLDVQPEVPSVPPTLNAHAYDLYLQGRYVWNNRTRESMLQSIDYYERAIQLDPAFAFAYLGIADALSLLSDYGWVNPLEVKPRIESALERARPLAPNAGKTLASIGLFKSLIEWDMQGATDAFEKAVRAEPSLATAHHWFGMHLMRQGRFVEAVREAETGHRLDPVSIPMIVFEGWVRYYSRDYLRAIEFAQQAAALKSDFPHAYQLMAQSAAGLGRREEALEALGKAVALTRDNAVATRYRGLVFSALPGHSIEAHAAATRLAAVSSGAQAGFLAIIYAGLQDAESMYRWMRIGVDARDASVLLTNVVAATDAYRHQPRFRDFMKEVGFGA